MRGRRAARGAGALLAAVALLISLPALAGAQPASKHAKRAAPLQVTVNSMNPIIPTPTATPSTITFELTVTNTTSAPLRDVQVSLERGSPIVSQTALDQTIAGHNEAIAGLPIPATKTVAPLQLPANDSKTTTFTTTTSTVDNHKGICLCTPAGTYWIYPLTFTASDSTGQHLGTATTFLPAAYSKPSPVQVSWLWPLLEHPHRFTASTVFTDDELAGTVAPSGRLARALDVVAQLPSSVPLTLVIDPELLDELEVMATGHYTVSSGGKRVPGTGQAAATAWLTQLSEILATHPGVQVALTPYADPDVESLTRNKLSWSSDMPVTMAANVQRALGERIPVTSLAWPAGNAVGQSTLDALARSGVSTVVLGSSAVSPHVDNRGVPSGAAGLRAAGSPVTALLTSPAVEKAAASAVTLDGSGTGALPTLLAELSVRVAQEPTSAHTALITPPRYVDADVNAAATAITQSSTSLFTRPVALSTLTSENLGTARGRLLKAPASAATLPQEVIDAAHTVTDALPALAAMFGSNDQGASALLTNLPIAVQRTESAAWYGQGASATLKSHAAQLVREIGNIKQGVRIVRPSSGSYTLASDNSPLPITVENDLNYAVRVRVRVATTNGLPGFTARETAQVIEAHSKRTVHVPTNVERSGRIQVQAELLTPDGILLGSPVPLNVHSTALGVIGIVITVVAGAVLLLALLIRLLRRLRARRRPPRPRPLERPDPVTAAP